MNTEGELKECSATVCIVGPGYVGLPLAEALSRHIRVMGYDVDGAKVAELSDKEGGIEFTTDTHLKGESAIIDHRRRRKPYGQAQLPEYWRFVVN